MIRTHYGGLVTVLADCGLHCPQNSKFEARLVKVHIKYSNGENQYNTYRFADFLKTDNGYTEIVQVLATVPTIELTGIELASAIEQAS